jgi:hypothetical protein
VDECVALDEVPPDDWVVSVRPKARDTLGSRYMTPEWCEDHGGL